MKRSLLFFHSEGALQHEDENQLVLGSRNLIDFIAIATQLSSTTTICSVINQRAKGFTLRFGDNVELTYLPIRVGNSKPNLLQVLKALTTLLRKGSLNERLHNSDICASVGLSGVGTMTALCRTVAAHKKHTFIVRGNRYLTVTESSRSALNKNFALFRIKIYETIMLTLVNRGLAEIWFQGEAQKQYYLTKVRNTMQNRLLLLNAVLRELPEPTVTNDIKHDLVFTGRLTVEKGLLELVQAISNLKNSGRIITLNIVGTGPDEQTIKNLATELDVNDQITFSGYITNSTELADAVCSARLFVLPSYTEGLPRSMLESMFLGTPILASRVGGIPFVIKNDTNGYLVEPGSVTDLTTAILNIFSLSPEKIAMVTTQAKSDSLNYTFDSRATEFMKSAGNQ